MKTSILASFILLASMLSSMLFYQVKAQISTSGFDANIVKEFNLKVDSPVNFNSGKPKTPNDQEWDLDSDSVLDFKISYTRFGWENLDVHGEGIQGSIFPINENKVYAKGIGLTLFLRPKDSVFLHPKGKHNWSDFDNNTILCIANSSKHNFLWQNEWDIQSKARFEYYYLALLIKNSEKRQVGYIKLSLNSKTGQIQIVDKKFTTKEFIIITE